LRPGESGDTGGKSEVRIKKGLKEEIYFALLPFSFLLLLLFARPMQLILETHALLSN
jgi:hypothetical protein